MNSPIFRPLLGLLVLFTAAGCSLAQLPRASDTFDRQWNVQDPTRTQPRAEIYFADDGLWVYRHRDSADFEAQFAPGDVAYFSADDKDYLFVIVAVARRGYRMQRLDDRVLATQITGDLRRLTVEEIADRDDLCLLENAADFGSNCAVNHGHQRWHLYELASDSSLSLRGRFEDFDRGVALPVPRFALAGGDSMGLWVEGGESQGTPVLAIGAAQRANSTLSARVTYDSSCPELTSPSSRVEFTPISEAAPLVPSTHPIGIEAAALRLGSDAIVTCEEDGPRLFVPMITRPLLSDDTGRLIGPSSVGLLPRRLHRATPRAQAAWATAGAHLATGDTVAAAFWIERAIDEGLPGRELEELALATMPILAGAGQSERAIRMGRELTAGAWNRENVPDYLDGLIVLLGQFGMDSEQRERIDRRQSLTGQRFDQHRNGWYRWADVRMRFANRRGTFGPAYQELLTDLEKDDLEGWTLAVWATLAINTDRLPIIDDPELLLPRFADAHAEELWRLIITGPDPGQCISDDGDFLCRPNSYGWAPSTPQSQADILDRLRSTPVLEVHRGFSHEILAQLAPHFDDPAEATQFWLASAPVAPHEDLAAIGAAAMSSLREQMVRDPRSICDDLPTWKSRFGNTAARGRSPVMERTQSRWVNFMRWWADSALEGLCDDAQALMTAMESHVSESNPWTASVLPILEDRLLRLELASVDISIFERAAALARTLGERDTCTLWSLGITVGASRSGQIDAARENLVAATNCLQREGDLRRTRNVVAGYLEFERGAGRSVVTDGSVDNALARATRKRIDDPDQCIGLLPLGFDLESQLPSSVMRIAERVQFVAAPHDEFRLRTASEVVDEARAAYLSGVRDLQRGRPSSAARAFDHARANFQRLQHLPGLVRIQFLDHVVYGGNLHSLVEDDDFELPAPQGLIAEIHRGQSHLLIDRLRSTPFTSSSAETNALLAALLITGRQEEIFDLFDDSSLLPASLCAVDSTTEEIVVEEVVVH